MSITIRISCILMRHYGKKKRIQKERWYQREINKEIGVLKNETKSRSHILGEMQQELDVLTALVVAQQALEREEQKRCNDDRQKEKGCYLHSKLLAMIISKKRTSKASKGG